MEVAGGTWTDIPRKKNTIIGYHGIAGSRLFRHSLEFRIVSPFAVTGNLNIFQPTVVGIINYKDVFGCKGSDMVADHTGLV
ncbi:hypothetical protein ES703_93786 [subsurface metagenome]